MDLDKLAKTLKIKELFTEECKEKVKKVLDKDQNYIITLIRDKPFVFNNKIAANQTELKISKGSPKACLIAVKDGDKICIGWSKRHPKLETVFFNRAIARTIAAARSVSCEINFISKREATDKNGKFIPHEICKALPHFMNRARKYFKSDKISNATVK